MNFFVTGAGGFIGSHVVEVLAEAGHNVRALIHYNSRDSWGHLDDLDSKVLDQVDVYLGDVTDVEIIRNLTDGCEIVLHLAALIGIPYSYHAPRSYATTNVVGTLNVLEACRQVGVKRVVVTSTSEVYGTPLYEPIDEQHPLQAQSPYAASKIGADKLAESYYASFGLPVVILRPFNTYGPRQSARAVIPTVLTQALADVHKIELGNLDPKRDLTFVEDTAKSFLLAAITPGIEGETIHFGQGRAVSIGELARTCLEVVGSDAEIVSVSQRQRPEKSEVQLLICDASKARRLLNWSPQTDLAEGLERTARYLESRIGAYRVDHYAV